MRTTVYFNPKFYKKKVIPVSITEEISFYFKSVAINLSVSIILINIYSWLYRLKHLVVNINNWEFWVLLIEGLFINPTYYMSQRDVQTKVYVARLVGYDWALFIQQGPLVVNTFSIWWSLSQDNLGTAVLNLQCLYY